MEFGSGIVEGHGDVLGAATDAACASLSGDPDLVVLFTTPDAASALETTRGPGRTLGCVADGVVGGVREVESGPAVVAWAARFGDAAWSLSRIAAVRSGSTTSIQGWRHPVGTTGAVLFADPASFPTQGFIDELAAHSIPTIGGLATSSAGTRLMLDGDVSASGALALAFGDGIRLATTVSQGCRPIGRAGVVTEARGRHVFRLGGRPAVEVLFEAINDLSDAERALARTGLQVGIVRNEYKVDFDVGDFLIRPVLDLDRELGYVVIGGPAEVGQTVQFHIRDPEAASSELDAMLRTTAQPTGAAGALLFTCNGRGGRFFGRPNHDAELVQLLRRPNALAGFFAAGEIGPVGGENHIHSYTATLVEFSAAPL